MEKTLNEGPQWKVTEKEVFESIVFEQYQHMGAKTTVCLLILNSGFEVVGTSAPVDAANFDFSIGKEEAKKKAIDKVWEYLGSIVQHNMAIAKQQANMKAQQENLAKQEREHAEKMEKEANNKEDTHPVMAEGVPPMDEDQGKQEPDAMKKV
jgi:hypothetical protein